MRWWKVLGLAGLAGVAATGVITVRDERRRHAYTPDEVRARLHERVAAEAGVAEATTGADGGGRPRIRFGDLARRAGRLASRAAAALRPRAR